MIRSLLILMLVTTQLLAGNCRSLHLCLSDDGSYCCIDAGPETCTCCQKHTDVPHDNCCDKLAEPLCEAVAQNCCSHHEQAAPEPEDQHCQDAMAAGDSCKCTHIPLIVCSATPADLRDTARQSIEPHSIGIPWQSGGFNGLAAAPPLPHVRWSGPPVIAAFDLTVISTVVIRC